MDTLILPVRHPLLRRYVQSFLFFKEDVRQSFAYTTFPNTNVCLAIYRNNQVIYDVNGPTNHCKVSKGNGKVNSRLYGFHRLPFTVSIDGTIDQICILFKPGGLRSFTHEGFSDLWQSNEVLEDLFPGKTSGLIDLLFSTDTPVTRANLLEQFLLSRLLSGKSNPLLDTSLRLIEQNTGPLTVNGLAAALHVNESTLYRLFLDHIGQSPKAFCQTIRFRHALSALAVRPEDKLTQLAYTHDYYDQAHYIKDLKQFTGFTPNQLKHKFSVEQSELIWIPAR
ncbi:helix-turn-helix domain-containing protein [Dyadobacter chenwenxiniae]|uniref:Helix-turn-helix domain-containing protein n=1 Tax=Dyadobacter chenwenxiniae TaxID=2906456 RepID=A0A9X1TH40_9BACT|nr:helix-turn-helix domain-containing protein [Dyadobacter chenwenxiniae]MCF0064722.1 helix-turn-helix domain-containing protein [Dyadobacter chenwenxiniae]UON84224.1 helix-turn-helix domain-containing protein [Dyadobacter chenwenxiniae]